MRPRRGSASSPRALRRRRRCASACSSASALSRPTSRPSRSRRPSFALSLAAAVAVAATAAAVALGVWAATLHHSLSHEQAAVSVLGDPHARRVPVQGVAGSLVVAPSGKAALAVDLPAPPAGKTYEAWVIDGGVHRDRLFDGAPTLLERRVGARYDRQGDVGDRRWCRRADHGSTSQRARVRSPIATRFPFQQRASDVCRPHCTLESNVVGNRARGMRTGGHR